MNGVVPEEQLPFSVVTSEVIALGSVTIDGDKVNLPLHSSGANIVRVKGRTITRTFPNQWTFTPIADNGVKVLRGYAVKTEDDFFLAEGPELPEYQQPEIPPDALELFEFEVTANGYTLVQEDLAAYKLKANDGWANVLLNASATPHVLSVHHAGLSFNVLSVASGIKIGGFNFFQPQYLHDGVEVSFRNETAGPIEITTVIGSGNLKAIDPEDAMMVQQRETATFKYHTVSGLFKLKIIGSTPDLSGYATIADLGNKADKDATGMTPANQLAWQNFVGVNTLADDYSTLHAEITALQNWKAALTDADADAFVNTLTELLAVMQNVPEGADVYAVLGQKVNISDVVDALTSNLTNAPLSARQGLVLKGLIDNLQTQITLKLDKPTTVIPYTEYLVGLDLNGDSTMISSGDLSFTSAFFTWNLTYMIPHSGTTYSTLKTGNPLLVGASGSSERLSKAIRFSSSGATIAFQRGGVILISTNSGIGTIELITQRKFLVETNINTQRVFVGISNNYGTTNPSNTDFSTLINTVGVILRESSPNWQFIHNNATGAPVITDTGLSHSSLHSFTWYFTSKGGVQKMILEKQSLATGVKEISETTLTKFSHDVVYFHALFCIDKNETSPVRMLDFGAIMQTKGFFL